MVYLLRAFGHEALQAHDGAEGIELVRAERPDLVLLDIHMPRMDGYEVVRQLRQDPHCGRIPLIAVTALAMVGDREKILGAGFNGYIAKPIDPEAFHSHVQAFLAPSLHSGVASQAVNAPAPPVALVEGARRKLALVLFVDNTQTNIDLLRSVLEPSGYSVAAAHSAIEGLRLARQEIPDLIVSDVHMPHQDGYDFMRMVKADPGLCDVPFVFLSSSVWSLQEQRRALGQGAKKFIARPIEPEVLLAELKECLPKV